MKVAGTALDRITVELDRDREKIAVARAEIARIQQGLRLAIEIMNSACRQIEELSSKPHPLAQTIGVLRGGAVTHSGPMGSGESVVAMNRLGSPKDHGDRAVHTEAARDEGSVPTRGVTDGFFNGSVRKLDEA